MAVAAWLVTAVATGYGVSAADTTGTSSEFVVDEIVEPTYVDARRRPGSATTGADRRRPRRTATTGARPRPADDPVRYDIVERRGCIRRDR